MSIAHSYHHQEERDENTACRSISVLSSNLSLLSFPLSLSLLFSSLTHSSRVLSFSLMSMLFLRLRFSYESKGVQVFPGPSQSRERNCLCITCVEYFLLCSIQSSLCLVLASSSSHSRNICEGERESEKETERATERLREYVTKVSAGGKGVSGKDLESITGFRDLTFFLSCLYSFNVFCLVLKSVILLMPFFSPFL